MNDPTFGSEQRVWNVNPWTILESELWINALADRTPRGAMLRAGLGDLVDRLLPLSPVRTKA